MANRLQNLTESLAVVLLLSPVGQAPSPATPEQLQAGQRVFAAQCGFCHGRDAMGGETGPNLTRSAMVRDDPSGDRVRALLREGRTDKGMPAFRLSDADVTAIIAFIRSQGAKAASPGARRSVDAADLRTGDAGRGRDYFNGTGRCATCHSPTGDLAGVAKRLQGLELLQRMLYPSKSRAATVSVTLRSGETVKGTLAYRDEFTIALTDATGRYRSWRPQDVTFTVNNPLDAHAEQLARYTDDDVHDVLAYLQTLK
ncbi:MAG TPA: c-type cytochrome [Vicinamibacterales bacterium]|nr:c-type cytochrome [Vicinamibacterales bacterium]